MSEETKNNPNILLLNKLLKNLLDGRLKRLETRSKDQMNDLRIADKAYKTQKEMVKKFSQVKIQPPKKPSGRGGLLQNSKSVDNVRLRQGRLNKNRRRLSNSNDKNNKKVKPKTPDRINNYKVYNYNNNNEENKKRKITPLRYGKRKGEGNENDVPSYMKGTTANGNKNKKVIKNYYYNLRIQKEEEEEKRRNNNGTKRNLTPERKIKKVNKAKKQNIKQNKNKENFNDEIKDIVENSLSKTKEEEPKKVTVVSDIDLDSECTAGVLADLRGGQARNKKTNVNKKDSDSESSSSSSEKEKKNLKNLGKWIITDEAKHFLSTLSPFLSEKEKYIFFSCSKKLIKNLYEFLDDEHDKFLEVNNISSISEIEDKISIIKLKYNKEVIETSPEFQLSRSTSKAIDMLNDEVYEKIFKNKELKPPLDEILTTYRILFQLIKKEEFCEIKDDIKFWDKAGDYILTNNNGKTGDFIKSCLPEFDFSPSNIYKLKKIVNGNESKLKGSTLNNICPTTRLITFLIKDSMEYCGIFTNSKKNMPYILLKYLEYVQEVDKRIKEYVNKLKDI